MKIEAQEWQAEERQRTTSDTVILRYCASALAALPAHLRIAVILNAATKALIPTLNRLAQLPRKCENNKLFCFCCCCCRPHRNSTQLNLTQHKKGMNKLTNQKSRRQKSTTTQCCRTTVTSLQPQQQLQLQQILTATLSDRATTTIKVVK